MQTHTDRNKETHTQSINHSLSKKSNEGESGFHFIDNRASTVQRKKLQKLASEYSRKDSLQFVDNRPKVAQMKNMKAFMNGNASLGSQAQHDQTIQKKRDAEQAPRENNTGLPNSLKTGLENLSGYSMDDVKVHYNSDKPAQLNALAYAKGSEIHLASGQEKHLPHEAWHVVQQKQGRVKPTLQMKGTVNVNDDIRLEKEADEMGVKAVSDFETENTTQLKSNTPASSEDIVQRMIGFEYELDGSHVRSRVRPGEKRVFRRREPDTDLVRLHKGMVIEDFGTFDVSVDSTPEGFDLEIRIHPVSENRDGREQLRGALAGLNAILGIMKRQQGEFSAEVFGGNPNVLISGDFTSGSLQATTGLNLAALHSFLSGDMGTIHNARMNRLNRFDPNGADQGTIYKAYYLREYGKGSPTIMKHAKQNVQMMFPKLSDQEKMMLEAVVTSVVTVPATARSANLPYAKSATTLLARTDYATILNLLPSKVLMAIGGPAKWQFLVLYTLNGYLSSDQLPQAQAGDPIFPVNSINGGESRLSLTLGDWLTDMIPGPKALGDNSVPVDRLSDQNYPRDQYPDDDFDELESLGQYGNRTDDGPNGTQLPIMEFRKFLRVPNDHLNDVVEGIWELVNIANRKKT